MNTLTLCMIVKDEEEFLADAIRSVQSIVSEIIIVDTGSSDNSIAIAQEVGAKVIQAPWTNDFSSSRNKSLEVATSDWILVLDADERIAQTDLKKLIGLLEAPHTCYEFLQRHYTRDPRMSGYKSCQGEYSAEERDIPGYFESNCCRLFPNHSKIRFVGQVHELVEHSIATLPEFVIVRSDIPIHHYGHLDKNRADRKKSVLYTTLGQEKITSHPTDWKSYYELGIEHNCSGRLTESAKFLAIAAQLNPTYVSTWVNFGYVLTELRQFEKATHALTTALTLDPNSTEALCNYAVLQMRQGNWNEATKRLTQALSLDPAYTNASFNLGQCYIQLGRLNEAEVLFRTLLETNKGHSGFSAHLGLVLLKNHRLDEAIELLRESIRLDPNYIQCYFYLGKALIANQQTEEGILMVEKFCATEEKNNPSNHEMIAKLRNECLFLRVFGS